MLWDRPWGGWIYIYIFNWLSYIFNCFHCDPNMQSSVYLEGFLWVFIPNCQVYMEPWGEKLWHGTQRLLVFTRVKQQIINGLLKGLPNHQDLHVFCLGFGLATFTFLPWLSKGKCLEVSIIRVSFISSKLQCPSILKSPSPGKTSASPKYGSVVGTHVRALSYIYVYIYIYMYICKEKFGQLVAIEMERNTIMYMYI